MSHLWNFLLHRKQFNFKIIIQLFPHYLWAFSSRGLPESFDVQGLFWSSLCFSFLLQILATDRCSWFLLVQCQQWQQVVNYPASCQPRWHVHTLIGSQESVLLSPPICCFHWLLPCLINQCLLLKTSLKLVCRPVASKSRNMAPCSIEVQNLMVCKITFTELEHWKLNCCLRKWSQSIEELEPE